MPPSRGRPMKVVPSGGPASIASMLFSPDQCQRGGQSEDDTLEMSAHRNLPHEMLSKFHRFYASRFHNKVVTTDEIVARLKEAIRLPQAS